MKVFPLQFNEGWTALKDGFSLFFFQAAVSLYTSFNVVYLGLFCSLSQVASYAGAERLIKAGLGFYGQISMALFPRTNSIGSYDQAGMNKMRKKSLIIMGTLGVLGGMVVLLVAPWVPQLFFKKKLEGIEGILNILAFVVPAISISNVLGYQYMLADRSEKEFNKVIVSAAVANLLIGSFLIRRFGPSGMALTWVVIEWLITITLSIIIYSKNRSAYVR